MNIVGTFKSPCGWLQVTSRGGRVSELRWVRTASSGQKLPKKILTWLRAYFKGSKPLAHPAVVLRGTHFQKQVWKELGKIPWGSTVSYQEIAKRVSRAKAVRAVASAVAKNPVPLFLPCHRVIGSRGDLCGYAFGLKRKSWLLDHEKRHAKKRKTPYEKI